MIVEELKEPLTLLEYLANTLEYKLKTIFTIKVNSDMIKDYVLKILNNTQVCMEVKEDIIDVVYNTIMQNLKYNGEFYDVDLIYLYVDKELTNRYINTCLETDEQQIKYIYDVASTQLLDYIKNKINTVLENVTSIKSIMDVIDYDVRPNNAVILKVTPGAIVLGVIHE